MNVSAQGSSVQAFGKAAAETGMTAESKWPAKKDKHPRSRVALLISFAVGLLLADPARATTIRAKYTISYLGLPVGDMETVKTFGVSTYQSSVASRVLESEGLTPDDISPSPSFPRLAVEREAGKLLFLHRSRGLAAATSLGASCASVSHLRSLPGAQRWKDRCLCVQDSLRAGSCTSWSGINR